MLGGVKSQMIFKLIFSNLKKKKKLNIIKYNKRIQKLLCVNSHDFEEFEKLKEINIKFNLDIKDTDIKALNIINKKLNDEAIINLCKINFIRLKDINISFNKIDVPVIANFTAKPETEPEEIKDNLIKQITGSVRWVETCQAFLNMGIEKVYECGSGSVLCGLVKKTTPEIESFKITSLLDFENL